MRKLSSSGGADFGADFGAKLAQVGAVCANAPIPIGLKPYMGPLRGLAQDKLAQTSARSAQSAEEASKGPGGYWSVVYTDAAAEHVARRGIEQRGFGCFLPHYRVADWYGGQPWEVRERPLLPRYVFVNLREDPSWVAINDAHGVQGVLMSGDAPARIPSGQMADLMLGYASGAYNTISVRDTVGRFRRRKRRRRPRHGRTATGVAANCVLFPQP